MTKKAPVKRFSQLSDKAKAIYREKLVEAKDAILLRGTKERRKKQLPQRMTARPPVKSSIERARDSIKDHQAVLQANLAKLRRPRSSDLQSQVLAQLQRRQKIAK
jgi:hypothetical protein